jgi:hypothetical protein
MELNERFDRLDAMITNGRVIRRAWTRTTNGIERACLLAALSPECGAMKTTWACPADLMPRWLAELVPCMDDNGTSAAWPDMVRRFASVIRRTVNVPHAALDAVRDEWLRECVVPFSVACAWSTSVTAATWAAAAVVAAAAATMAQRAATGAATTAGWSSSSAEAWDFITADLLTRLEACCAASEAGAKEGGE